MHHTDYLRTIVDTTTIVFITEDKDEVDIVVINEVVDASEDEGATIKQIHLQYNYNMHKTILLFPVRMEGLLIL